MIVVVSEKSRDSEGKDQILSSSQQTGSNDEVTSMALKYFLIFQMLVPSGVWVACTLKLCVLVEALFSKHTVLLSVNIAHGAIFRANTLSGQVQLAFKLHLYLSFNYLNPGITPGGRKAFRSRTRFLKSALP